MCARPARISRTGKIRPLGAERQTSCRRLLRAILAAPVAVSRSRRLGNALDRQSSRHLRRHLQNGKDAKPALPVAGIWHNNSFNPIYRAEQDLHELSNYSDFIKVVMYNNLAGSGWCCMQTISDRH